MSYNTEVISANKYQSSLNFSSRIVIIFIVIIVTVYLVNLHAAVRARLLRGVFFVFPEESKEDSET